MTANVGLVDRGLRVLAGLLLIGAALGIYGPDYLTPWGWVGVIPLVSGLASWCPAYKLLGLSTCKD